MDNAPTAEIRGLTTNLKFGVDCEREATYAEPFSDAEIGLPSDDVVVTCQP